MADFEEMSRIFAILSVSARLRLLYLVQDRPLCVGALAHRLGLTPGAVSQHLRVLREAGLVTAVRCGYFVHYRLNRRTWSQWRKMVGEFLASYQVAESDEPSEEGERPCVRPKASVKSRKN